MINSNDRFVRWQTVLRQHFSYMNNLLLTISVGVVGFLLSVLDDVDFNPVHCEKLFFTAGLILVSLSVIMGFITGLSRLIDFRITVKKIKTEMTGGAGVEMDELKEIMKLYGHFTWGAFYIQISSFAFGVVSLILAFILLYSDKLF